MRKQTKLVAVLSTAALLAIGASMTSFAAQGWAEEDGTWVYNKDGEKATESWKKSGDNWYWLDDNGEMATDVLVEDDDDYYYVDANGAMVRNQWVAIENEDAGEEDEPDHYWYYFQANGKAYKKSENTDYISKKVINGKRYAFDEEGRMLYGWVDGSGERQTEDDAWKETLYYFGDEDDGAMSSGWRLISIVDEDGAEEAQPGDQYWDEDQDRWFYFKSSGKKEKADTDGDIKVKKINGKRYGFDYNGRMVASWNTTLTPVGKGEVATNATATSSQGTKEYTESFMYFSSPEDGARFTKGWFKVVPGYYLNADKYDDDSEKWFYADGDGNLVASQIKKIKDKKYAFDKYGQMLSGLRYLTIVDDVITAEGDFDDEDEFNDKVGISGGDLLDADTAIYYFGSSDDGAMKYGKQTVDIDGDNFTFKFENKGSDKGKGLTRIDDKKLYIGGKLIKADSDDKYMIVYFDGTTYEELEVTDLIDKDNDVSDADDKYAKYYVKDEYSVPEVMMVNSTGSISVKSGAKNGDEYKFYFKTVDGKKVLDYVTLEK